MQLYNASLMSWVITEFPQSSVGSAKSYGISSLHSAYILSVFEVNFRRSENKDGDSMNLWKDTIKKS